MPDAAAEFDSLIRQFRDQKKFGQLFEARLMKARHELGMPLWPNAPGGIPESARARYDAAVVEAAREAGRLFLDDGQIARSWPYFRALGEPGAVREAIDKLPLEQAEEGVIDVALNEQVHPGRGFEMVLSYHGICRAITLFDQYPHAETRPACLALLVRTIHADLLANLRRAVEKVEGTVPDQARIPDLLRDWMFGPYDYFVDVSHLGSIVRHSVESADPGVLAMALDLTDYGRRLSPELQYKGDPPFEDLYADHAVYLRALAGVDVDECVAHFEAKADSYDYEQMGTYPAQIVVRMLVRLNRLPRAVELYERHCAGADPMYLHCPPYDQLCLMANDHGRLRALAEREGDPLRELAARIALGIN
jgi:hypothetical protein